MALSLIEQLFINDVNLCIKIKVWFGYYTGNIKINTKFIRHVHIAFRAKLHFQFSFHTYLL